MNKAFDHNIAIFVFGSNEGGWHGAGAAKFALDFKGAKLRQAYGLQGQAFAIPTKDESIRNTLSLPKINRYVEQFMAFAEQTKETHQFQVTRIGCGLAGLKDADIAPMFHYIGEQLVDNVWFDEAWEPYLTPANGMFQYWGTK